MTHDDTAAPGDDTPTEGLLQRLMVRTADRALGALHLSGGKPAAAAPMVHELRSLHDVADLIGDTHEDEIESVAEDFERGLLEPHDSLEDALAAQALLLDRAFSRLVRDTAADVVTSVSATEMHLALRTQAEFRRTLETLRRAARPGPARTRGQV